MQIKKTTRGLTVDLTIHMPHGLHARPSARLAQTARKYVSDILVISENGEVDAKSMLDVLSLASHDNARITLLANGPDAGEALADLYNLLTTIR